MKILHIDDHKIFTQGLALALEAGLDDTRVVCGSSASEALALLDEHDDVDLAILDLGMPGIDGHGLIDAFNERHLTLPIVVMSAVEDPWQIRDCLNAGAVGFIPKTFGQEDIIHAIRHIIGGNIYLPDALKERLSRLPEKYVPESRRVAKGLHLNKRQMDVLGLMQRGYGNREIADILCISEHTVKSHARVLYQALGVGGRLECVREAERCGLL